MDVSEDAADGAASVDGADDAASAVGTEPLASPPEPAGCVVAELCDAGDCVAEPASPLALAPPDVVP
ncbi:hypothetical protein FM119_10950 [Mycetocola reblochoni REB411]|uniref:Uncharacterized protein n=1 Tax=Mycetocola reblochoni REB411 TaxID=1255698 RepID=A0A1R4K2S4_9MICO|nr:hypothetical protein FM119_10950 [Mycetocola reblochoni REB411]